MINEKFLVHVFNLLGIEDISLGADDIHTTRHLTLVKSKIMYTYYKKNDHVQYTIKDMDIILQIICQKQIIEALDSKLQSLINDAEACRNRLENWDGTQNLHV